MKSFILILLYMFLVFIFFVTNTKAQSITIDNGSIGIIIDGNTNQKIGTGFVFISKKQVVTCAHVANVSNKLFYQAVSLPSNNIFLSVKNPVVKQQ